MENTIGERLKELRISRDLTQEEVGKVIGVQKAAIYKYEKGYIKSIKPEHVEKLSEFYGVPKAYILCLEEERTKEEEKIKEILETLANRPELVMFFNRAKYATAEDIIKATKIIETIMGSDCDTRDKNKDCRATSECEGRDGD